MRKRVLNINEMDVTSSPIVYTCYGLGSCIGLFVSDRVKKLTAGAHIPFPFSDNAEELHGANRMIDDLMHLMEVQGSDLRCLRAKLTGGAQVYPGTNNIGRQNIEAVLQMLTDRKVYVASSDVGGQISRTARFNSETGDLYISTSEQKTYCI